MATAHSDCRFAVFHLCDCLVIISFGFVLGIYVWVSRSDLYKVNNICSNLPEICSHSAETFSSEASVYHNITDKVKSK